MSADGPGDNETAGEVDDLTDPIICPLQSRFATLVSSITQKTDLAKQCMNMWPRI